MGQINTISFQHSRKKEKKNIFFPPNRVTCRTCHKPRVKHRLDLNDFSAREYDVHVGEPHGAGVGAGVGVITGVGVGIGVGDGVGIDCL